MSELTPNLQLVKPTINGEDTENTWGYDLNANFDILDDAIGSAKFGDGDKGDIIVSAQGELWTFDPTVVTPAGRGVIAVDAKSGLLEQNGATAFKKRGITVAQQPPSGGADGDLWLQYNLALPPEVNWDVSSAVYNTRVEAMATDIPNTVLTIQCGGWDAPGDCPPITYARVNTLPVWYLDVATPMPISPLLCMRSLDRNKLDGSVDPTTGGYWVIVPIDGNIHIGQVGGKADYIAGNPASGTDISPAIVAVTNFIPFDPSGNKAGQTAVNLILGFGKYKCASNLLFNNIVAIIGQGNGFGAFGAGHATQLHFTTATGDWMAFMSNNSGWPGSNDGVTEPTTLNKGTAGGSYIRGFSVHEGRSTTFFGPADLTRAAITSRTVMTMEKMGVYKAPGHAFYIRATAGAGGYLEGNANVFRMLYNMVHSCRGHALWIAGMDTNASINEHFSAETNEIEGCGIFDGSGIGCTHIAPHITGYGNHGVSHLGGQFCCIDPNAGHIEPGGTPTSYRSWHFLRAGGVNSAFPAWSVTADYSLLKLPMFIFSTASSVHNPYVEDASIVSHSRGPIFGGNALFTPQSPTFGAVNNGVMFTQAGVGSAVSFPIGSPEYNLYGGRLEMQFGGTFGGSDTYRDGANIFRMKRLSEGDFDQINWIVGSTDILWTTNGKPTFGITTTFSPQTLGRTEGTPGKFIAYDIVLRDPSDFSGGNARVFGVRPGVPNTPGSYAAGERYYYVVPVAGGREGNVVITAGALAEFTWLSGQTTGAGATFKNSANRVYRSDRYGTTITEPTHTSGTVMIDGINWTWIGDNPPVFKEFGSIAA